MFYVVTVLSPPQPHERKEKMQVGEEGHHLSLIA